MFAAQDCKTISTEHLGAANSSRRRLSRGGYTLIEFIFAVGLTGIFVAAIVSISLTSGRSFAEMVNYVELDQNNRTAMDNLSKEIRQVNWLSSFDATHLTFIDNDGQPLTYEYSPSGRSLTRTKHGATTLLLTGCDSMNFDIYQRSPQTNSYDLIAVAEATNCKVVSITWTCSRSLLGNRANTDSAQVAKIVLRNKQ
jgi:Tfp pilus assembly protein PilW